MSDATQKARREQTLKPLRAVLLPVPAVQTGVCSACHSGADLNSTMCGPCREALRVFGWLPRVVPITMSENQSQLHYVLRGYKDGHGANERARKTQQLAALVSTFVEHHGPCLGDIDIITTVPSLRRDAPGTIVKRVASLAGRQQQVLRATRPIGHRDFSETAFDVDPCVRGQRLLLLDDTFTTGSAVYSAAAAIHAAGGHVAAVVAIGRHVNDWHTNAPIMEWLRELPWRDEDCCLCAGAHPPGRLPI